MLSGRIYHRAKHALLRYGYVYVFDTEGFFENEIE